MRKVEQSATVASISVSNENGHNTKQKQHVRTHTCGRARARVCVCVWNKHTVSTNAFASTHRHLFASAHQRREATTNQSNAFNTKRRNQQTSTPPVVASRSEGEAPNDRSTSPRNPSVRIEPGKEQTNAEQVLRMELDARSKNAVRQGLTRLKSWTVASRSSRFKAIEQLLTVGTANLAASRRFKQQAVTLEIPDITQSSERVFFNPINLHTVQLSSWLYKPQMNVGSRVLVWMLASHTGILWMLVSHNGDFG